LPPAADLEVLLDLYDTEEPIWVEEQDHGFYIVHMDDVQTFGSDLTNATCSRGLR